MLNKAHWLSFIVINYTVVNKVIKLTLGTEKYTQTGFTWDIRTLRHHCTSQKGRLSRIKQRSVIKMELYEH